jgi:hypothetical protein
MPAMITAAGERASMAMRIRFLRTVDATGAHPGERHEDPAAVDLAEVEIELVGDQLRLRLPACRFAKDIHHRMAFDLGDGHDQDVGVVGHA